MSESLWDEADAITSEASDRNRQFAITAVSEFQTYVCDAKTLPEFESRLAISLPAIEDLVTRTTGSLDHLDAALGSLRTGYSQKMASRLAASVKTSAGARQDVYKAKFSDLEENDGDEPDKHLLESLVGKYLTLRLFNIHGVAADYESGRILKVTTTSDGWSEVEWLQDGSRDSIPMGADSIHTITRVEEPSPQMERLFARRNAGLRDMMNDETAERTAECKHCGEQIKKVGPSWLGTGDPAKKDVCHGTGALTDHAPKAGTSKTATRYCTNHDVYVGEGNQENHDHCTVETRKKKESGLDFYALLKQGSEDAVKEQFEKENPSLTEGCDVCGDSGHTTKQHEDDPDKYDDAKREGSLAGLSDLDFVQAHLEVDPQGQIPWFVAGLGDASPSPDEAAQRLAAWAHENPVHAYEHGHSVAERQSSGVYVGSDEMGSETHPEDWLAGYQEPSDLLARSAADTKPNLFGDQDADEFRESRPPRTTRPRQTPQVKPRTEHVRPDGFAQAPKKVDFNAPSYEQQVAAKIGTIARRVIEDNPHLTLAAAREMAIQAMARPGVVATNESRVRGQ